MKYSKVMQRVFSDSAENKSFQKKFSEALELAETEGSAKMTGDDEEKDINLELTKKDDGSIEVKDLINDEVTIAKQNPEDADDVMLEKQESEPAPVVPTPVPDNQPTPDTVDKVTISEITPNEEYEIKTKESTFSVKGDIKKAIVVAKKFSEFVDVDFTEQDGTIAAPAKDVPANTGVEDPDKTGMPAERSFSEALECAKKEAEVNEDGALLQTDKGIYHVSKTNKGFSFCKIDLKNRAFSELPEVDFAAENDGTNIEPAKDTPANTGVEDPDKTGMPAERSFSEGIENLLDKKAEELTTEEKGQLLSAANKGCEKSIAKLNELGIPFTKTESETEEDKVIKGVTELEKKAEEVESQPTQENAQSLKENSEELAEKIEKMECGKTFSAVKKASLLARVKAFSQIAESVLSVDPLAGEDRLRSFSAALSSGVPYKVFATKEQVEEATKQFSQVGETQNPLLRVKF